MADNVAITAGAGTTVATDDIGGVHYQLFKQAFGPLDTATLVSSTNPLPTNPSQVGSTAVNAFPAGFQRVTDEPRQVFYDPFDAALDTTNRWNTATAAGGGVAAAVAAGVLTIGSGTTINGYSYLTSRASFVPTVPAWLGNSWAISIESAVGTNAVRFWGHGTVGGTPSSTSPLGATGNGYGFEIDIAGVLQAVVYANGTRTAVASLAAFQPSDAAYHRYICFYRTDRIYWYVDGLGSTQLAATSNFQGPQVQTQPLLALSVAHSTAPAASRVISCAGLAVWDTGKNSSTISDGTYPWRKMLVGADGAIVAGDKTDVGRVTRNFILDAFTAAPVADALQSVAQWYNNAAVAATTQPAVVPAGKTLRITGYRIETKSLATVGSVVLRVRANTAGLAVIGSPLVLSASCGTRSGATTVAMTGGLDTAQMSFPEGIDIPAAAGVGFSLAGYGPTGTLTLQGVTRFEVWGYEYTA